METTAARKYFCNCLNVCIQVGKDSDRLDVGEYHHHLSEEEKQHDFFDQLPLIVVQRCVISEQHTALIQLIVIGSWVVRKCAHCSLYTHATKSDESTMVVFINDSLKKLTDEESELLKSRPEFSPVFQVLVTDLLYPAIENGTTSHLNSETSNAISELKGLLIEKLEERRKSTDEMIKRFVKEQEDALKGFVKRANEDFQSVKIAMLSHAASENRKPRMSTKNMPLAANVETVIDYDLPASPAKAEPKIKERNSSFDSEGLFLFDETGDNNVLEDEDHSEEDLSDTDDSGSRDEGIYIPRRKSGAAVARSLPIRVPVDFGSRFEDNKGKPNHYNRKTRPERPVDIAASMKALAKSVHGDTIFGDLPPPRIGSRI